MASKSLALLLAAATLSLIACTASGAEVVLVGLSNRQCNAAGRVNLDGKVMQAGDRNMLDSPAACCSACKLRNDCNVWTYCAAPGGCDAGGVYQACTLKQDWNIFKYKRVISNGPGWVSGYIAGRCPGTDPYKLLALQRVNFPSFTSQCQPGSSCTACMCTLSKAMTVAQSEPKDLSLCMKNFRTVMMFPSELGGSSLSATAYQRLQQCAVADPPCTDQRSAVVFGTLGPAVVASSPGSDLGCLANKSERDCATACLSANGCNAFVYNAMASPGRCCLKSGATMGAGQLSDQGDQMYIRLPAGTTAEDGFFTQTNPWGVVSAPATGASPSMTPIVGTPTTAAAPSSADLGSSDSSTCVQTSCGDAQPPAYSCSQQASWGKCGEGWMKPYCQQTCKRCPCATTSGATPSTATSSPSTASVSLLVPAPTTSTNAPSAASLEASSSQPTPTPTTCTCTDVQPNRYPCSDEARWGKCSEGFMRATKTQPEGYCQISCGRCACPLVKACTCSDIQPFKGTTCVQHAAWGSCGQEWMWMAYADRPRGYCQTTCGRCKC